MLLPPSGRGSQVEARIEVEGADECFNWSASSGLHVRCEGSGGCECAQVVHVSATDWLNFRSSEIMTATGSRSHTSLQCDVEVDQLGALDLEHATHQVPIGGSVDVRLKGMTRFHDVFDNLEGLRFHWQVRPSGHNSSFAFASTGEATVEPQEYGSVALITGLSPGAVVVSASLVDERFTANVVEREFLVTPDYIINPDPAPKQYLLLAPGAQVDLTAYSPRNGRNTVDTGIFRWISADPSVASVGETSGSLVANCVGYTFIELFLRNSTGRAVGHRAIKVERPHRVELTLDLQHLNIYGVQQWPDRQQWPLKANSTYTLHSSVSSRTHELFMLGKNERISLAATASVQQSCSNTQQPLLQHSDDRENVVSWYATRFLTVGDTLLSGAELSASLEPQLQRQHWQNCSSETLWQQLNTVQRFQVCSAIVALPEIETSDERRRVLHLPLPPPGQSSTYHDEYPLEFSGGCTSGNPARFIVRNSEIARLDHRNEHVVPRASGSTHLTAQPQRDLAPGHIGDEISLFVSYPSADGRPGAMQNELGIDVFPGQRKLLEAFYLGKPPQHGSLRHYTLCSKLQHVISWRKDSQSPMELAHAHPQSPGSCAAANVMLPSNSSGHVRASMSPLGRDAQPLVLSWEVATVEPLHAILADTTESPFLDAGDGTIAVAVGGRLSVYLKGGPVERYPFPRLAVSHSTSGPIQVRQSSKHQQRQLSVRDFDVECTQSGLAIVRFEMHRQGRGNTLAWKDVHLDCAFAESLELTAAAQFADNTIGFTQGRRAIIPEGAAALVKAYAVDNDNRRLLAPPADSPLEMAKLNSAAGELRINGVGAWASRKVEMMRKSSGGMIQASATGLDSAILELFASPALHNDLECPLYLLDAPETEVVTTLSGGSGKFLLFQEILAGNIHAELSIDEEAKNIVLIRPISRGHDRIRFQDTVTGELSECSVEVEAASHVAVMQRNLTVLVGSTAQIDAYAIGRHGHALHAGPNAIGLRANLITDDHVSHEMLRGEDDFDVLSYTKTVSFLLRPNVAGSHRFSVSIRADRKRPSISVVSAKKLLQAHEQFQIVTPPQLVLRTARANIHAVEVKGKPHEALLYARLRSTNRNSVEVHNHLPRIPSNSSETATFFVRAKELGESTLEVWSTEVGSSRHAFIYTTVYELKGVTLRAPQALEFNEKIAVTLQPKPSLLSTTALGGCSRVAWSTDSALRVVSPKRYEESASPITAVVEALREGSGRIDVNVDCINASYHATTTLAILSQQHGGYGIARPHVLAPAAIDGSQLHGLANDTAYSLMSADQSPALDGQAYGRGLQLVRGVTSGISCALPAAGIPRVVGPCVRIAEPEHLVLKLLHQPNAASTIDMQAGEQKDLFIDAIDTNGISFSRSLPGHLMWVESTNTLVAKPAEDVSNGQLTLQSQAEGVALIVVTLSREELSQQQGLRVQGALVVHSSRAPRSPHVGLPSEDEVQVKLHVPALCQPHRETEFDVPVSISNVAPEQRQSALLRCSARGGGHARARDDNAACLVRGDARRGEQHNVPVEAAIWLKETRQGRQKQYYATLQNVTICTRSQDAAREGGAGATNAHIFDASTETDPEHVSPRAIFHTQTYPVIALLLSFFVATAALVVIIQLS